MWGEQVMVAPITAPGETVKTFYIPAGAWINMNTMKAFTGPRWITDSALTMEAIPVFAKEGSFLPLMPGMQSTEDYQKKILNIIYIPSSKPGGYKLYEDDGSDPDAIKNKHYEITSFKSSGMKQSTTINIYSDGNKYKGMVQNRQMLLTIPHVKAAPKEIRLNGKSLAVKDLWDANTGTINIPFVFQHARTSVVIDFNNDFKPGY